MKNTILSLNTIYTYTNDDLSKKNTIIAMIPNFGYREITLSSSGIKIFKKTRNNKISEIIQNKESSKWLDRDLNLDDIKNFRKYIN